MVYLPDQQLATLQASISEIYPVALIRCEHNEIQHLIGINFSKSFDELTDLFFAVLPLPSGNQVVLVNRLNAPQPGTEICVKPNQTEIPTIIHEVLEKLSLSVDNLSWVNPDHKAQFYELINLPIPSHYDQLTNYPQEFAGVDFSGCDLQGIDFEKANLRKTILKQANLSRANLLNADLCGADLSQANLQNADLRGANLSGANLSGTNLEKANLQGANLQRTNLRGARLTAANLDRT